MTKPQVDEGAELLSLADAGEFIEYDAQGKRVLTSAARLKASLPPGRSSPAARLVKLTKPIK